MCWKEISLRLSEPFGSNVLYSLNHRTLHLATDSFITSHHQETNSLLLVLLLHEFTIHVMSFAIWENPGDNPIGLMPAKGELCLAVQVRPTRWDCGETKCPTKKGVIVNGRGKELSKQNAGYVSNAGYQYA